MGKHHHSKQKAIQGRTQGKGLCVPYNKDNTLYPQKASISGNMMITKGVTEAPVDNNNSTCFSKSTPMYKGNDKQLSQEQTKLVESYLSSLRAVTVPENADYKLKAEVVPFDQGVAIRIEYGKKDGNYYNNPKENIVEASLYFGIDLNQYLSDFKLNRPELNRTYVINNRKKLYLIKGFAPENWGNAGVQRDIAAIKGSSL
ncbi:hypothetical protein [Longitalea luteola]|uniref:hypothetical protein n=1 Tax=Longitalea luteola TaxID=2812563 RepID=UPI001A969D3B|nr:hypothetical protein [Longitalea luteola]